MLTPENGADGFEIVIGGWRNSQSVLRDQKQTPRIGYSVTKVF